MYVLYIVTLCYIVLHCVTLLYFMYVLYIVTLCYIVLHCVTLHVCTVYCYTVLHCVTLCYIILHYIVLHCVTSYYITLCYTECILLEYMLSIYLGLTACVSSSLTAEARLRL